ncbi:MAG: dUTPase [Victivallaceae bacterium]|nr:dUTPase [Victivallaceae bacterium]
MDNSEPVVPVTDERPDWLIGAERWYEDMRPFLQPIVEISHDRNGEFANLAEMFRLQAGLNENLDASMIAVADEFNERDIAQWTQDIAMAMHQELAELVDCVPWKWWANYQDYDRQNARVEIVDLFHFLISMAQLHGMTAQDVFDAYKAKCEINHKRHESGYTEKDPDDCKCI